MIYSYFNSAFTAVKRPGCKVLNKACERGHWHCQQKVYEGVPVSVKNGIYKSKGLDLGAEPPFINRF